MLYFWYGWYKMSVIFYLLHELLHFLTESYISLYVSGCKKLNCNNNYVSKVYNDVDERRYIHAPQAQAFF